MKKPFPTDTAETRRQQLNRSATDLAKIDRFPGDSEHRRNHDAILKMRRKRVMGRIGDTLCVLAFIAAALTVGASLALQI